jgi:hypothetical protein
MDHIVFLSVSYKEKGGGEKKGGRGPHLAFFIEILCFAFLDKRESYVA